MAKKIIYCFDIDGTVCSEDGTGDYSKAKPLKRRIAKINKLHRQGHTILFFTSRGKLSGINWEKLTKYQFKRWKLKHHEIIFGKPYFDLFVDNRALDDKTFFKLTNPKSLTRAKTV